MIALPVWGAPGDTQEYELNLKLGEYSPNSGGITISAVHNGKHLGYEVIRKDSKKFYPEGTAITLKAFANDRSGDIRPVFKTWLGDIGGNSVTSTSITINMDSTKEISAYFDDSYRLKGVPSPAEGGTVFPSDDSFYLRGQEVTLTAYASMGYRFTDWGLPEQDLDNASTNNESLTITMDAPKEVTAYFKRFEIGPESKGVRDTHPWGEEYLEESGRRLLSELRSNSVPWITGLGSKHADDDSPQPEEGLDVEDAGTEDEAIQPSLEANLNTITETVMDESGCVSSTITIHYEAKDITGGSKPITSGKLTIDGEEHTSWSGTPTTHYQDSTLIEGSGCDKTPVIQLAATNSQGEKITNTKEAMDFPVAAVFLYQLVFRPGGGEYPWRLDIDYQGHAFDSTLTNVVLKANGQEWDNSGTISTDSYEDSFSKDINRDGGTFNIEVIATNDNGDKATYRETIQIPAAPGGDPPEDPEYPPPPPPPQQTLWAKVSAGAECAAYGPECSCQLIITINAQDLTSGTFQVRHVELKVNGEVWHDSGPIMMTAYNTFVQETVNCGESFDIELTVKNTLDQTVIATTSIITPIP